MFHNHDFKKRISLKIVAMQSDNITFYACKIIKGTSGFNLKKTNFSPGGAQCGGSHY